MTIRWTLCLILLLLPLSSAPAQDGDAPAIPEPPDLVEVAKHVIFPAIGPTFSQYSPYLMKGPDGGWMLFSCRNTEIDGVYRDRVWRAVTRSDYPWQHWQEHQVIIDGSAIDAEDDLCCSPGVVWLPWQWHLYYVTAARKADMTLYLYHAEAEAPGEEWSPTGRVSGLEMPFEYIETPSPINHFGRALLYYVGPGGDLFRAASSKGRGFWNNKPVHAPGGVAHGRVTYADGRYYYVYARHPESRHQPPTHIWLSVSDDGKNFSEGKLLFEAEGEGWDADRVWSPHLVKDGERFYVVYAANEGDYGWWGANSTIGLRVFESAN